MNALPPRSPPRSATPPSPLGVSRIEELRALVARIERGVGPRGDPQQVVPIAPPIDRILPEGGLAKGAVHEVLVADPGAAAAFAVLLAARMGGVVLWLDRVPDAYPPGLLALGLPPELLLVAHAADARDLLWGAEEALRSGALGSVIAFLDRLDLASSRRLQLAAEAGGTLGLLLRPDRARPAPSSAATRWRVGAAPGGGAVAWSVELLRSRNGRVGRWRTVLAQTGLAQTGLAQAGLAQAGLNAHDLDEAGDKAGDEA